jgi:hypothetical protein
MILQPDLPFLEAPGPVSAAEPDVGPDAEPDVEPDADPTQTQQPTFRFLTLILSALIACLALIIYQTTAMSHNLEPAMFKTAASIYRSELEADLWRSQAKYLSEMHTPEFWMKQAEIRAHLAKAADMEL